MMIDNTPKRRIEKTRPFSLLISEEEFATYILKRSTGEQNLVALKMCLVEGIPVKKVADALNVSRSAIYNSIVSFFTDPNNEPECSPDEFEELVARLRSDEHALMAKMCLMDGIPVLRVADIMNVERSTVLHVIRRVRLLLRSLRIASTDVNVTSEEFDEFVQSRMFCDISEQSLASARCVLVDGQTALATATHFQTQTRYVNKALDVVIAALLKFNDFKDVTSMRGTSFYNACTSTGIATYFKNPKGHKLDVMHAVQDFWSHEDSLEVVAKRHGLELGVVARAVRATIGPAIKHLNAIRQKVLDTTFNNLQNSTQSQDAKETLALQVTDSNTKELMA